MVKLRHAIMVFGCGLLCCIPFKIYRYFTDKTVPSLVIDGVVQGAVYGKNVLCSVCSNKAGTVSVYLDEKSIFKGKIKKNGSVVCTLPVTTIESGSHALVVRLVDKTYNRNAAECKMNVVSDLLPLEIGVVQPTQVTVVQGRTVHICIHANKGGVNGNVSFLGNDYPLFTDKAHNQLHEAFIPIACEELPGDYSYRVTLVDSVGNSSMSEGIIHIEAHAFKKETISVTAQKVAQEKEVGLPHRTREEMISRLTMLSEPHKLWRGIFCTPIEIERITCEFGTIRTTQHKGRYAHKALDIINKPKSVVWAPHDGIIVLKERFADTGCTVGIDHGCSVITLLCHLDSFANIEVGDMICKGNPIGTIGKTGYATGYHVHWEMRVANVPVDPMQWIDSVF